MEKVAGEDRILSTRSRSIFLTLRGGSFVGNAATNVLDGSDVAA
jgi:hypothetical protein